MKRSDALALVSPVTDEQPPQPQAARPTTRGECERGPRPCGWLTCRYSLGVEQLRVHHDGSLTVGNRRLPANATAHELEEFAEAVADAITALPASCVLDVVDALEGATLDQVGRTLSVTRERSRQIETRALRKLPKPIRHALGVTRDDVRASKVKIQRSDDAQPYPQRAPIRSTKQRRA